MKILREAMTDMFRILLAVALPVILILALLLLYRFLWPSSSVRLDSPFSQQSKMIYPDNSNKNTYTKINTYPMGTHIYDKPEVTSDL